MNAKKPETKVEEKKDSKGEPKPKKTHAWVNKSIEEHSNCFNKLLFWWTTKIIDYGNKNYFTQEDLFDTRKDVKFDYSWGKFQIDYESMKKLGKISVLKGLYRLNKGVLWWGIFFNLITNMIQFAGPYLLKAMVAYCQRNSTQEEWKGFLWAALLFLAFVFKSIINQHSMNYLNTLSFRSASALQGLVLNKLLKLKSTTRNYLTTGKVITTSTIDAFSVYQLFQMAGLVISTPFVLIISIILVIVEIGPVGFVGVFLLFVGTYASTLITNRFSAIRKDNLKFSDRRSKTIEEFISGIRLIKYYGWEKMVLQRIADIRAVEMRFLFIGSIFRALLEFVTNLVPLAINIAVFGLYVALNNDLTPSKAYATLAFFNILQMPIRVIGFVVMMLANTKVSVQRMQHYTGWEEFEKNSSDNALQKGELIIKEGDFSWDTETAKKHWQEYEKNFEKKKVSVKGKDAKRCGKKPAIEEKKKEEKPLMDEKKDDFTILKNINLHIKPGELAVVIGTVGSGKSSLVSALLGEMNIIHGKSSSNGRVAYVPQQAWLQNTTLKENILFGSPLDEARYQEALSICELGPDVAILPGKDLTEIGERGINLSGGQKQRVALARAVYYDADIYLIDDCLSALDAHVGKKIFDNVIRGKMHGKTIIFVTHALQYITSADRIIVMKQGRIEQMG